MIFFLVKHLISCTKYNNILTYSLSKRLMLICYVKFLFHKYLRACYIKHGKRNGYSKNLAETVFY